MRAVWQRVLTASVKVEGSTVGKINKGALVLLGIEKNDSEQDIAYIADKCVHLRLFEDEKGKFNHSTMDIKGEILLVSQFTLYGDCRKGRRPSFSEAALPEDARTLYEITVERIRDYGIHVETGKFQADMEISLINYGPVTVILDSKRHF